MTYLHAKVQGQGQSFLKIRVETNEEMDRRTDGGDCITCRINADTVGNKVDQFTQETDLQLYSLQNQTNYTIQ